jgi:hypothetical protein
MGARNRTWTASSVATALGLLALPAGAEEAEVDPSSQVRLDVQIVERGPLRPWHLRVTNVSDEAVDVVVDPRLLTFEVTVPEKKGTTTCRLPSNMVPSTPPAEAVRLLEPGQEVRQRFDPRFYCFSEGPQTTLVPGAELLPTYGWPTQTKTRWVRGRKVEEALPPAPPWLAEPAEEESDLEPVQNVPVAPLTLGPDYALWGPNDDPDSKETFTLSISKGVDAVSERGVVVNVVLRNVSGEKQQVFYRRDLLAFEVLGPKGHVVCPGGERTFSPTPASFSTMGPGSSRSLASRLIELCPRGTFSQPGFYLVSARFDATVGGGEYGLEAFTGTVHTTRPATIRVRTGESPFLLRRPPPRSVGTPPAGKGPPPPAGNEAPTPPAGRPPRGAQPPPPGAPAVPPSDRLG